MVTGCWLRGSIRHLNANLVRASAQATISVCRVSMYVRVRVQTCVLCISTHARMHSCAHVQTPSHSVIVTASE